MDSLKRVGSFLLSVYDQLRFPLALLAPRSARFPLALLARPSARSPYSLPLLSRARPIARKRTWQTKHVRTPRWP